MRRISVVVSNFNGAQYLPRLVTSLEAQEGVQVELIVVDRDSVDESDAILARHPSIKVVKHPPEAGLVAGYAAGLSRATHDLVFFCNEDMWLRENCLHECAEVLLASETIAAVMPVQWTYDGSAIYYAGGWYEKCRWYRGSPVPTRRARWHPLERPARVSFANAGACLVRRSAYEDAGGWDTTFFLDYEDVDLGIRLWQRGWECWVAPAASVGHAVGASNQKLLPSTGGVAGRKRYVHSLSNFLLLALKYFSLPAIPMTIAAFLDVSMRDLLTGRLDRLFLDVKAAQLTGSRATQWVRFRRTNRVWNRAKPGEEFFVEPVFQYEAIRNNRSRGVTGVREAI